uniref:Uncharacterized protein n=1 Tax=Plectus sambesii TaxID=2011161 RepID=A0A914VHQ9_9BILA
MASEVGSGFGRRMSDGHLLRRERASTTTADSGSSRNVGEVRQGAGGKEVSPLTPPPPRDISLSVRPTRTTDRPPAGRDRSASDLHLTRLPPTTYSERRASKDKVSLLGWRLEAATVVVVVAHASVDRLNYSVD